MRIAIIALLIAAAAVFSGPSCVIGGDEPWDDNPGGDTDTDGDGDGDTESDTNTELYDGDGGADGGVDAG